MKYFFIITIFLFTAPTLLKAQETTLTGSKVDTINDLSDTYPNNKTSYYTGDDVHRLAVFVGLGASFTTMGFNDGVSFPVGTKSKSFSPLISAGIDMLLDKKTQHFVLRFEGSIKSNKFNFENIPINTYTTATLKNFRQTTLTFSPQIIYHLNFIPLFISTGLSINGSIYNDHSYTRTFTLSDGTTYTGAEAYPRVQRLWLSIPAKVGASITKKLQIYAGYSWYTSYGLDEMRYPARMNAYQGGFYYVFK